MKRTTIMLTDDLDLRLRLEATKRGTSVADIARQALEKSLPEAPKKGALLFFGVGEGEPADVSERVDEFVAKAVYEHNKPKA